MIDILSNQTLARSNGIVVWFHRIQTQHPLLCLTDLPTKNNPYFGDNLYIAILFKTCVSQSKRNRQKPLQMLPNQMVLLLFVQLLRQMSSSRFISSSDESFFIAWPKQATSCCFSNLLWTKTVVFTLSFSHICFCGAILRS